MSFEILALKPKAFSLTELLVTLAIIGTLSVVGIRTYRNQLHTAKTAEAQQILSFIYSNERQFYNAWNTYHENLVLVGAAPSGNYRYDAGFTETGGDSDGDLGNYPFEEALTLPECIDLNRICDDSTNGCIKKMKAKAVSDLGSKFGTYFEKSAVCNVDSALLVSSKPSAGGTAIKGEADEDEFKAYATSKLGGDNDIWSINEKQEITHEEDGTN